MSATTLKDFGGNLKQHYAMSVGAALRNKGKMSNKMSASKISEEPENKKPSAIPQGKPSPKMSRHQTVANDFKSRIKGAK